jgi:hypothetical protein
MAVNSIGQATSTAIPYSSVFDATPIPDKAESQQRARIKRHQTSTQSAASVNTEVSTRSPQRACRTSSEQDVQGSKLDTAIAAWQRFRQHGPQISKSVILLRARAADEVKAQQDPLNQTPADKAKFLAETRVFLGSLSTANLQDIQVLHDLLRTVSQRARSAFNQLPFVSEVLQEATAILKDRAAGKATQGLDAKWGNIPNELRCEFDRVMDEAFQGKAQDMESVFDRAVTQLHAPNATQASRVFTYVQLFVAFLKAEKEAFDTFAAPPERRNDSATREAGNQAKPA